MNFHHNLNTIVLVGCLMFASSSCSGVVHQADVLLIPPQQSATFPSNRSANVPVCTALHLSVSKEMVREHSWKVSHFSSSPNWIRSNIILILKSFIFMSCLIQLASWLIQILQNFTFCYQKLLQIWISKKKQKKTYYCFYEQLFLWFDQLSISMVCIFKINGCDDKQSTVHSMERNTAFIL